MNNGWRERGWVSQLLLLPAARAPDLARRPTTPFRVAYARSGRDNARAATRQATILEAPCQMNVVGTATS